MNLKNHPPVFVPEEYAAEVEKLSKAALMDMVWDFATQFSGGDPLSTSTVDEFRSRREIVLNARDGARRERAALNKEGES